MASLSGLKIQRSVSCGCSLWKFPGQGLNLSCSGNLHHSFSNTGSLTHCTRPGIEPIPQQHRSHCRDNARSLTHCATVGTHRAAHQSGASIQMLPVQTSNPFAYTSEAPRVSSHSQLNAVLIFLNWQTTDSASPAGLIGTPFLSKLLKYYSTIFYLFLSEKSDIRPIFFIFSQ